MGPKPPIVREEKEDLFQAILLVDNFDWSIFGPGWERRRFPNKNTFGDEEDEEEEGEVSGPRGGGDGEDKQQGIDQNLAQESLLPLGNRKLLDYSLEALTVSGVQEIFIYCSSGVKGANAVNQHIKKSRWDELNVSFKIISSEDCESLGDALRDLYGQGQIRGDFILMRAGVVTNIPLKPLLEDLRRTMKEDKGAVMTLIHRKMPIGHRSRSQFERQAIVVDKGTGKIISYSDKISKSGLKIPAESLRPEMEVVLNTVDTGILVCSSSVLPFFADNFDFTNIEDFVKNTLLNEEVMGNTIYLHQLKGGYATRIVDYDSYMGVSSDILQRWSYPLVPDMPFGSNPGELVYQMGLNFVYKAANAKTARDATIGPAAIIGSETAVLSKAKIKDSSIGKHCVIGPNTTIIKSQLGDNVVVDDGCVLERCVILDGSHVTSSLSLRPSSLIIGKQVIPIENVDHEEESDDDSDAGQDIAGGEELHQERDFMRFCEEVMESLHRGFTDNVAMDNLFVEIQGSRTANFMYFDDAGIAVSKGILGLAPKLQPDFINSSLKAQWDKTKDIVVFYKDLLTRFVKNAVGQENLLKTIEEYANDNSYFRPMTMQLLHYYYQEDVLPQEVILKWYHKVSLYEAGVEIRQSVQKFVQWLETASSEEESEDSDGD